LIAGVSRGVFFASMLPAATAAAAAPPLDPTQPSFGGSVKTRHIPVDAHLRYNEIVQAADRPVFDKLLMHLVAFAAETEPMPADASDAVRALYAEAGAGDEVQYMIQPHYEKDDERVRYYDVWVRYAPNVSLTFYNLSTRLYGLEPVYLDPYEIRVVTDWEMRRVLLKVRIIGSHFPRFSHGEHIYYHQTPTYAIPGSPLGVEGRGIKRRHDVTSPQRTGGRGAKAPRVTGTAGAAE
jgi:hypothetical protein